MTRTKLAVLNAAAVVLLAAALPAGAAHQGEGTAPSPTDTLGGIGGQGTARGQFPDVIAAGETRSPFDGLGGIGGESTARSA